MFIAARFAVTPAGNNLNSHQQENELKNMHKLLIYAPPWINLKIIILKTVKYKIYLLYEFIYMAFYKMQTCLWRQKVAGGCLDLGVEGGIDC